MKKNNKGLFIVKTMAGKGFIWGLGLAIVSSAVELITSAVIDIKNNKKNK